MIIYGLMLMGLCMFAGLIVGDLLGLVVGISANIGGIGFAMLFLVMYIPIVVAMSANQNVIAALKGGPVALIAGVGAVFIGFLLIKPLSKIGGRDHQESSAVSEECK